MKNSLPLFNDYHKTITMQTSLQNEQDRITNHMVDDICPVDDEVKYQMYADLPDSYKEAIIEQNRLTDIALDRYMKVLREGGTRQQAETVFFETFQKPRPVFKDITKG